MVKSHSHTLYEAEAVVDGGKYKGPLSPQPDNPRQSEVSTEMTTILYNIRILWKWMPKPNF